MKSILASLLPVGIVTGAVSLRLDSATGLWMALAMLVMGGYAIGKGWGD